jgi:hypothetical protein
MHELTCLPHVGLLLEALRISPERLASRSKIAVDTRVLRALLEAAAVCLPFDTQFYLSHNPDIARAYKSGLIGDVHRHFIETGFFEDRFGVAPSVDEAFYIAQYKDIAPAVQRGDISCATEHYPILLAGQNRNGRSAL